MSAYSQDPAHNTFIMQYWLKEKKPKSEERTDISLLHILNLVRFFRTCNSLSLPQLPLCVWAKRKTATTTRPRRTRGPIQLRASRD